MTRKSYTSDETDDEWAFITLYLTLMREDAPQREHDLRAVFNGLPWVVERSFAWTSCFRRLASGFERLPETFRGLHFLAFAILMLRSFIKIITYVL